MNRIGRLLPLVLAACAHVPASVADRAVLDAVEDAWDDAGDLPASGRCLADVEVRRHDTRASYVDECQGSSPELGRLAGVETSAGCLTYALRGAMGRRVTVIELAPGYHADQPLVQHEACHALVACTLDRPRGDPWDAGHSDVRVWQAVGGPQSVQGRALDP